MNSRTINVPTRIYGKTDEEYRAESLADSKGMTAVEVFKALKRFERYGNILVDEFTWGELRIDAILIDTEKHWIRGFEIKVSHSDFVNDEKWQLYSKFCSSLSIVCPWGLIEAKELDKPYGLLWISRNGTYEWQRRPKNFQKRDCLAWQWQYYRVVEKEFSRLWWVNKV